MTDEDLHGIEGGDATWCRRNALTVRTTPYPWEITCKMCQRNRQCRREGER